MLLDPALLGPPIAPTLAALVSAAPRSLGFEPNLQSMAPTHLLECQLVLRFSVLRAPFLSDGSTFLRPLPFWMLARSELSIAVVSALIG